MCTANLYRFHDGEEKKKKLCTVVILTNINDMFCITANMLVLSDIWYFLRNKSTQAFRFTSKNVGSGLWRRWRNHKAKTWLTKLNLSTPGRRATERDISIQQGKINSDESLAKQTRTATWPREKCSGEGCCLNCQGSFGEMRNRSRRTSRVSASI